MSLYFDNIIANAETLPLPKPITASQLANLLKNQKKKRRKKEKLLFCYPLDKLTDYSSTRSPHNQRIFKENEIPQILKLRDTDPEIYRCYYYHRDLNLLGNYKLNDSLIIENRLMASHILKALQSLDTMKLFTMGKKKFKTDESLVCYLSGMLNQNCSETLKMLETRTPAELLQYVPIDIDAPSEEEAQRLARTMDLEETRRLALLLITKAVRYDDCWKSMFWAILCTTPLTGNISRNTRVKYLKNEEEPKVEIEEDEDAKFNRIMAELHEDMAKLNIKTSENRQYTNKTKQNKSTNTKSFSLSSNEPLDSSSKTTSFEFFQPQQFKMYKLKHPLFMPISEEFLLDSSDDELIFGENYNSESDSNCSESEVEQEPSDSYSYSQNQFELLTNSSIENSSNNNSAQDELVASSSSSNGQDIGIVDDIGMTEQEYSEFVYDELDEDPNFIDLVETLADLFPTYAKTDLKFRLKFADSVEELIEELFIETESRDLLEEEEKLAANQQRQVEPVYDDKVYQLREMFPNIDNATIDRKLRENNNSLEDTTMALLSLPTTEFLSVSSQNKFTVSEWNKVSGLVIKITKFLGINEDTFVLDNSDIAHFVRKSGCNYYDALVGILMNCRPLVLQTVRKQQVGGRVQRGGKKGGRSSVKTITKLVKSNYRYNPISNEAKELWELVPSNEQLKSINKTLLINALEFFQGNVYKVIELVSELSSNQTPQHTINTATQRLEHPVIKFVPKVENDPYALIKKKFSSYADTRSSRARAKARSGVPDISEQNRFYQYIESGHVDLHRFRLTEAMKLTKLVLQHWWEEEEKNRELDGKIDRFGDKASIGPVRIITGRGIHSANGVSILKRYVKEYLVNNRYVFNEEIGSFEVIGKKRR